jgi:hypothetical protein
MWRDLLWRQVIERKRAGFGSTRRRVFGIVNLVSQRSVPTHFIHPSNVEQARLVEGENIVRQGKTFAFAIKAVADPQPGVSTIAAAELKLARSVSGR